MSAEKSVDIVVRHQFAASCERVFDAWLDPASIGGWMFGSAIRDEEIVHLRTDARVGGRFSFLVLRNGQRIDHVGTYLEIDRPRRLAFTWAAVLVDANEDADESSRVTIELAPHDGGCTLTLTHAMDPKWADSADRTRHGWTTILDALDRALAPRPH